MRMALTLVILGGTAIGLALPGGRQPAPAGVKQDQAALRTPPSAPISLPELPPPPMASLGETVIQRSASGHFATTVQVNTMAVDVVVDTGADTVALTQADARRANIAFDPAGFTVIGRGASGPVRGQVVTISSIMLDGKQAVNVEGVVLEAGEQSLLGHSYLRQLASVEISGDTMTLR